MWSLYLALAVAQSDTPAEAPAALEPSEEIIVWGDRFLRWERRWYVETEVHFSDLFTLFADNNLSSRFSDIQIRAVFDCDRDIVLGPRREEVHCTIEDIALVGVAGRPGSDDLAVLREADAAMTGAAIQLQVTERGGVPNVTLEGLSPLNARDRQREEQYRQLLSRVVLPFHLGLPPVVADGVKWYEYNSQLLSMPSLRATAGGTQIAHFMDVFDGHLLVQTLGEGTLHAPRFVADDSIFTNMPRLIELPPNFYDIELHGVAVFELDTGIMSERVWNVTGTITASSPDAVRNRSYRHTGRLAMLGQQDRPDVGQSFAAEPGGDGADAWVPIDPNR